MHCKNQNKHMTYEEHDTCINLRVPQSLHRVLIKLHNLFKYMGGVQNRPDTVQPIVLARPPLSLAQPPSLIG